MYRIAICDDISSFVMQIEKICNNFFYHIEETCSIETYSNGLQLLKERKYFDILFLDIKMPHINGIKLAQLIRKYDTSVRIIFATSYADYKNHAFSVHAFGYITKPYETSAIESVLQDAVDYSKQAKEIATFTIKTSEGREIIDIDSIYYLECRGHTITLHTKSKSFQFPSSLKQLYKELNKYGFEDCHRSYIVNMQYIKRIKGCDIILDNNEIVPISQKKASMFKNSYNDFLQNSILKI